MSKNEKRKIFYQGETDTINQFLKKKEKKLNFLNFLLDHLI